MPNSDASAIVRRLPPPAAVVAAMTVAAIEVALR